MPLVEHTKDNIFWQLPEIGYVRKSAGHKLCFFTNNDV